MYIVPLNSSITPINTPSQSTQSAAAADGEASFLDVFKSAFETAQETQRISDEDSVKVMLGEIDDLSEVSVNAQKAALALQTFVALKNTAVDAYKELMNMQI